MAISAEDRLLVKEGTKILDSFMEDGVVSKIDEAVSSKMVDLKEIEKFLEDKDLSYIKFSEEDHSDIDVVVEMFFLSTKTVKVDPGKNKISYSITFNSRYDYVRVFGQVGKSTLEKFIDLPKASHGEDVMSAKDVVKLCEPSQIYNIYQDKALSIMRKLFSHPYHMFTGPNLYKKEEPEAGTLYVTYDKVRKKFKYAYNPGFILECAIEEWVLQRDRYKSFEDCYVYILAFLITHEMLHIVHHNTISGGKSGDVTVTGDHGVSNQIQDSFINCKIARRYIGVSGINSGDDGLAPMPKVGIGSKITVRAEHNNGFKSYNSSKVLGELIVNVITKLINQTDLSVRNDGYEDDISDLAGADVFIVIDVNPRFSPLRSSGSNIFQRVLDDIIRVITGGKVYGKFTKMSDAEKATDLDVLPDGTLVMVKGTRDICHVQGYNKDKNTYELTKAKISGVKKIQNLDSIICVTEYEQTEDYFGSRHRVQIKPYNPMDDAYVESNRPKKDKLSKEDLQKVKADKDAQDIPQVPSPNLTGGDLKVKNLGVGDIVWIRKLKKFGRIVSIIDGVFNIEEMVEKPAKIIDDSDNY